MNSVILILATIVDDMTETPSPKNKEVRGQGIANFVTGFFGGMAGCAMIGQSVINVKSGGNTRLSSLIAGVFLLVLILMFGDIVAQIPMAAGDKKTYRISGQLFFGSTTMFMDQFTYQDDPDHIIIDMEFATVWDHSGVIALAKVINKYEDMGKQVELVRLNQESARLITRIGLAKPGTH